MMKRLLVAVFAFALLAAGCGSDSDEADEPETTEAPTTTAAPDDEPDAAADDMAEGEFGPAFTDAGRSLDAPEASITVDGDASDWADVDGLDMTLYPLTDEALFAKESMVKVAHDGEYVYVLFEVDDDLNFDPADPHLTGSSAVQWVIDDGAGVGMGATDEEREASLGGVDIWHWELECASGVESGGAFNEAGEGKDPGNDAGCNFDDEYAKSTEDRVDDNGSGAENSLLGIWSHTAGAEDEDGTWIFEMRRPLQTGDDGDVQLSAGSSVGMALAYWDADNSDTGWEAEEHVTSGAEGWITVNFLGESADEAAFGPAFSDEGRSINAPQAAITVDGDMADWGDVPALDMTLYPIMDEALSTKEARMQVAHDGEFVYVLMLVGDDLNFDPADPHLTGSSAVQWVIDDGAGVGMGATDEEREASLGGVDIWHWELECASGVESGGAFNEAGEGKDPGNDAGCNFDDEYAKSTEDRVDDNGSGAENSLLGIWGHTNTVENEDGTWIFEMRRPLQTGDDGDVQLSAGSSASVAIAYWDADNSDTGWEAEEHVTSAAQGWITVNFE